MRWPSRTIWRLQQDTLNIFLFKKTCYNLLSLLNVNVVQVCASNKFSCLRHFINVCVAACAQAKADVEVGTRYSTEGIPKGAPPLPRRPGGGGEVHPPEVIATVVFVSMIHRMFEPTFLKAYTTTHPQTLPLSFWCVRAAEGPLYPMCRVPLRVHPAARRRSVQQRRRSGGAAPPPPLVSPVSLEVLGL